MAARSLTETRRRQHEREQRRERRRASRAQARDRARRAAVALAVLVPLALIPVFVSNPIGYVPVVAYVLLVALSAAYIAVVRACLRYEEATAAGACVRGEAMRFSVRFKNKGPLPLLRVEPAVFVTNAFHEEVDLEVSSLSLAPFEEHEFTFEVRFDHIGTYEAGVRSVEVRDLVGLFSAVFDNESRHAVEVLPRVFDVSALGFDHELLKERPEARTPMAMEGGDYTGVRGYVMGDPMKSIHWKLSARGEDYYTKLFETPGAPGIEVVLDFRCPDYGSEDMMCVYDSVVECGLSVGAYAQRHGMDFSLAYVDKAGRDHLVSSRNSRTTRAGFLSSLPMVSPRHGARALRLYGKEAGSRASQPNLVLCTSFIDGETARAVLSARRRGCNPSLVAVVPPSMSPQERASYLKPLRQLDAAGVSSMAISSADQVGGVA